MLLWGLITKCEGIKTGKKNDQEVPKKPKGAKIRFSKAPCSGDLIPLSFKIFVIQKWYNLIFWKLLKLNVFSFYFQYNIEKKIDSDAEEDDEDDDDFGGGPSKKPVDDDPVARKFHNNIISLIKIQSNLALRAVRKRENLTLRDKLTVTDYLCSKSPSR